jgi:drug/metabolite transporter (DMT)-like permease
LRFVLLAGIWGLSFLFIKVSVQAFAPLQVAFGRVLAGLVTLLAIVLARRARLPSGWRLWGHLAVAAVLLNTAPFALFAYGEQHVSSVLAGIWNATTPLFTLPVAALLIAAERPTASRFGGLLIGFGGVLTVLGIWRGLGGADLPGDLMCMAAAACYGLGFPYARRFLSGRGDPLILATGQLACAAVQLAVLTLLLTSAPAGLQARPVISVLVLGVLGTGIAYILNYSIVKDAGATVASTVTYAIPVFSTLAGVLVLREPLTWNEPVGVLVILTGALITQGRLDPDRWRGGRPARPRRPGGHRGGRRGERATERPA